MTSRDQLIEALAHRIAEWKLVGPAVFFLELARPFGFVAGQGLLLFQPLVALLGNDQALSDLAALLDDRANIDRLLARLQHGESQGGERPSDGRVTPGSV
jgi:hypothetical protein